MGARRPKVTIAIPSYRRPHYLAIQLQAVLDQTFADREILVVDNGSSDDQIDAVRPFEKAGVRIIRNDPPIAPCANWNRCIELAQGELICVTHDDDRLLPRYLEKVVAIFDASPNVGFVHANYDQIDGVGARIAGQLDDYHADCGDFVALGPPYAARVIVASPIPVCCPAVTVRRSVYDAIGVFDPTYESAYDLDLWLRILDRFDVGYVGEPVFQYRRHPQQGTGEQEKAVRYIEAVRAKLASFERLTAAKALSSPEAAMCRRAIAKASLKLARKFAQEEPAVARAHLKIAFGLRASSVLTTNAIAALWRIAAGLSRDASAPSQA